MLYKSYLKKGMVYLPTTIKQGSSYLDIEPVTVVPVTDTKALRCAMREAIQKQSRYVPPSVDKEPKPPVLLKHTGDKSWSAFKRGASLWSIYEENGKYQIEGYRTHRKGYWEQDPNEIIEFSVGTSPDIVIDRMIAILQDAARQ
jgi:hypothetical protein